VPELLQGVAAKLEAVPPVEKLLLVVADARVEPWKLLAVGGVEHHLLLRGEPEELLRTAHHLAHHLPWHAMVDHLHVTVCVWTSKHVICFHDRLECQKLKDFPWTFFFEMFRRNLRSTTAN
jgi:hypothetical protein